MPAWTNVDLKNVTPEAIQQFNIEFNRRINYYLRNINIGQILFGINDLTGTLLLSKGGTGTSLTAPTSNALMGYDLSSAKAVFYGIGAGLALDGTTLYNSGFGSGSTVTFYKITASTANLGDISSTNLITANRLVSSSGIIGELASTGAITANVLTASSATFGKVSASSATLSDISSTGTIASNVINAKSGNFGVMATSSGTIPDLNSTNLFTCVAMQLTSGDIGKVSCSSATLPNISSTNLITSNKIASSSGAFGVITSSSATIGSLGSTGSITANIIASSSAIFSVFSASSATLPCISSTNAITANTMTASSGVIGTISSTGAITANTLTASSATFTKLRSSSAIFGNSTSYATFEDDGTLALTDGAKTWVDELGDILKLKIVGVGITEDSTDATVNFDVNANLSDFVYTNVQLNHIRYLYGNLSPHIHFLQNSTTIPNMLLSYRYLYNSGEIATAWTYLPLNIPQFTYVAGTTIHQIFNTSIDITPSSSRSAISDIVQFKIFRDTQNASTLFSSTDNLATSVRALSFDVHYEVDSLGSRSEYSK